MSLSLAEFIVKAHKELKDFEKSWKLHHAKYPEEYLLEMKDGDEGLWWQFLQEHDPI